MSVGFIGDVHGEYDKLVKIIESARARTDHLIFLGDYVNRGPDSKMVIELLVELRSDTRIRAEFCQGNHDLAFLDAIEGTGLRTFLRMGGAATLSSYLHDTKTDLLAGIRTEIPEAHVAFLRDLKASIRGPGYVATHTKSEKAHEAIGVEALRVYGHRPQARLVPTVTNTEAWIDTGCGTIEDGRLTCFFLPEKDWIQVS